MKNNVRYLLGLIAIFLMVTVSACGSSTSSPPAQEQEEAVVEVEESASPAQESEPVELVVWALGNSGPGIENALPGFKEKYPNVDVDLQVFGWNDLLPKLQATLTAGEGAPDVVEIFSNQVVEFGGSGVFTPLNDRIEPYRDNLTSFALLDSIAEDGNIYALVWDVSPSLLYYRSDIFEAEGIDPATLQTWDDLIAAGEKVTHDDQYMFLTASQATYPQYWNYFTGMLSQYGGSPFDAQGNITINESDNALKVLQTMEAIDQAEIALDVDSWWTPAFEGAIKSGNLASFASGAFHISILKGVDPESEGLWRVQLAPTFADGEKTGIFVGGGRGLVIPTQTKNPDEAWAFIEYVMLTPEGVQATWEGGAILPVYAPAYEATYFDEPDPYYGDQAVGRIIIDGLEKLDGHQWFTGPISSAMMSNEIVGPQLRALMLNEVDAQTALEAILSEMEANKP